jgi:pyruvate/2-oxoacid:ferredoxin oxidoreductase alpha subunit
MSTVNYTNPKTDLTVRVFDNFFNFDVDVPVEEYDIVYSFFRSVFATADAAGNFTVTLFRVAEQTSTPVLTLLNQLQGENQLQITATMAYFLNGLRSPSTLLGYSNAVVPNFYTARNVKA